MKTLRVGTRSSALALKQTELVIEALKRVEPSVDIDVVGITTKGDRLVHVPLAQIGGKGVFVKEVEAQLLDGTIDFAVHSLKDVPARMPEGLTIVATPKRANPFDCLIWNDDKPFSGTAVPMVIGTSSVRRINQLKTGFPDMSFMPIRGNIETRLRKMKEEGLDGIVLAAAGLERMDYLKGLHTLMLEPEVCVPAIGQGIMAVQCREGDKELMALLRGINDEAAAIACRTERFFLHRANGNCDLPIGGYAHRLDDGQWEFLAFLAESTSKPGVRKRYVGDDPLELAKMAAAVLLP
ncbi:MAG: hydroxymethylbilane synthase [Trichococcus flocculiformis]|uniref:Porphobilinogen deaminase n=1 Tax=Trichococcus flocculiformis TaxID=82803 RepID=A0A847D322_9LACT|nr:hydroxymethylbilane synthase [Trichococcus flocculiformis]NLD31156.1 hydroxymethylbilane synthase [Trichococcus flocculiformis]